MDRHAWRLAIIVGAPHVPCVAALASAVFAFGTSWNGFMLASDVLVPLGLGLLVYAWIWHRHHCPRYLLWSATGIFASTLPLHVVIAQATHTHCGVALSLEYVWQWFWISPDGPWWQFTH